MTYNYDKKRINYMANTMLHLYIVFYQTNNGEVEDKALNRIHAIRDNIDRVLESFGIPSSWFMSWNILEMVKRCAQYKVYGKIL